MLMNTEGPTATVRATELATKAVTMVSTYAASKATAGTERSNCAAAAQQQQQETEKKVILNLIQPKFLVPITYDIRSQRGQFGWHTIGSIHVPYIFRTDNIPFISLRIINQVVFPRFFNSFRQSLFDLFKLRSNTMTEPERRLYNEINTQHCDFAYGLNSFQRDERLLLLDDVIKMYDFLEFIYGRLVYKQRAMHPNFGYMNFTTENVVPFCVVDGVHCVPVLYFEGDESYLKRHSRPLGSFNESVMRFLMRLQCVTEPKPTVLVISLDDVRQFAVPGNKCEEGWIKNENDVFTNKVRGANETSILKVINSDIPINAKQVDQSKPGQLAIICSKIAT